MKQLTGFLIMALFVLPGPGCKTKDKPLSFVQQETDIKKWEKAVVNIECQELRYSPEQIDEIIEKEKNQDKLKTEQEEFRRRNELGRQTDPVSGTAIYLTSNGRKYLVTAKHVIFDPQESNPVIGQRLYKDISIRTPYDYYLKRKVNNSSIPSTGYGVVNPFYLSDDGTDIGIISLQASLTNFLIKTLEEDGYEPISINDMDTTSVINEGDNIATIGYPDISKIGVFQKINDYQSNVVVLPVSTFGSIAMAHEKLPYLISDITIYPGNSGGPIIRKNKLVGMVSGQVLIPVDSRTNNNENNPTSFYSRGTLAKVIKVQPILYGLQKLQQMEADKSFR